MCVYICVVCVYMYIHTYIYIYAYIVFVFVSIFGMFSFQWLCPTWKVAWTKTCLFFFDFLIAHKPGLVRGGFAEALLRLLRTTSAMRVIVSVGLRRLC